jgi:hypothetical protein
MELEIAQVAVEVLLGIVVIDGLHIGPEDGGEALDRINFDGLLTPAHLPASG